MYKIGEDENCSYSLNLDDIDLDYIEQYLERNDTRKKKKDNGQIFFIQDENRDYYELEVRRSFKEKPIDQNDNGGQEDGIDLPTYIKMISSLKKCDKTKFVAHCNSTVGITTASGDTVWVSADNFHGFATSSRGNLMCKVCRVVPEDKHTHTMSVSHMTKVAEPIKDSNLIRPLDIMWNHCILCNDIIHNEEFHIRTCLEHKTSVKAMTVYATQHIQNPQTSDKLQRAKSICCKVCQCFVPYDRFHVIQHIEGASHVEAWNEMLKDNKLR